MDSRERIKLLPELQTNEKHSTKKELARTAPRCPPVPKIRKAFGRELFNLLDYARPVFFDRQFSLNKLYDKTKDVSYMHQVFQYPVLVGEGSFGSVYRARSREDGLLYAIKVSKDDHGRYSDICGEVRKLEKISNEHCVKYFGAWEEEGRFHLQLELCMISMEKYAHDAVFIPEEQIWDVLVDMLLALKYLHSKNYIHMDIKLANILATESGYYKLGDFGLLVDLQEIKKEKKRSTTVELSEGDAKYLAAEVLEGKYSKNADIFSLGISLMELGTDLVLPSNGPLWHQLRFEIYPDSFEKGLTDNLKHIITGMMKRDYTKRPSANRLLQNSKIVSILEERTKGHHVNYMLSWRANNEILLTHPTEEVFSPVLIKDSPESSSPKSDRFSPYVTSPYRKRRAVRSKMKLDCKDSSVLESNNNEGDVPTQYPRRTLFSL